jgi:hypothetical protein
MVSTVEKKSWTAGRRAICVGIKLHHAWRWQVKMVRGWDATAEANQPRSISGRIAGLKPLPWLI